MWHDLSESGLDKTSSAADDPTAQSQAELRNFIEGLSHQLKTPLTAIIGLTETLLEKQTLDPATQQRFLEKIGDQARRLSSVLDDLLTLSALQSEGGPELESLDLRVPLAAAAQDHIPLAEEKGLELSVDLPTEAVVIKGEYGTMRTLLGNLLDNAIKYTPYGGSIMLQLAGEERCAEISVVDTGVGIALEEQTKVFGRFYRGSAARTAERRSTGLGLAIAEQIVHAHRGEIKLSSVPGEGTTFTIRLPLAT